MSQLSIIKEIIPTTMPNDINDLKIPCFSNSDAIIPGIMIPTILGVEINAKTCPIKKSTKKHNIIITAKRLRPYKIIKLFSILPNPKAKRETNNVYINLSGVFKHKTIYAETIKPAGDKPVNSVKRMLTTIPNIIIWLYNI